MKRIFLLSSLFLFSFTVFAQQGPTESTDTTVFAGIPTIADLRAINHHRLSSRTSQGGSIKYINLLGYYRPGDGGGTPFYWSDTCTLADDSGMIIKPNSVSRAGRWLRSVPDGVINSKWYGMRSYLVGLTDVQNNSYYRFMAAVNFIYRNSRFKTLYIPADTTGQKVYYFTSTITINRSINIIGDSHFNLPAATLLWPENTKCILVTSDNYTRFGMSNFNIYQAVPSGKIDSTAHGLEIHTFCELKNINLVNYTAGDGVRITACAAKGSPIFGNADHSVLENVQVYNSNNGLYISGCDANVISIKNSSFVYNRRWGVYDDSFLGNYYENTHYSSNGTQGRVCVTYGGNYYVSEDSAYNVGKRPDLHPEYWYKFNFAAGATPWDATTQYFSGGTAAVVNVNAFTVMNYVYSESYQPPILLNGRSYCNGGDNDSPLRGGARMHMVGGLMYFDNGDRNTGIVTNKIHAGLAPTGAVALTTQSVEGINAEFETTGSNLLTLKMKNTHNAAGGIAYYDSTMLFRVLGGYSFGADFNQLFPWSGDRTMSLGKPTHRWRNIYSENLYASKLALGGTPGTSAILDVQSTSKGILFPRMTQVQRLAISSPEIGLIVYQIDGKEGVYIHKSTGWTFAF